MPLCYPIAIYYLSMIYSDEEFKDEQLSLQLLIKAADLGFPEAQRKLSIVYSDGDGIEKNTEKANILLEKSATAGDEVAQFLIAQNYYFGDNSYPQNYNLAFGWAKKSAEQGNSDAQNLLSTMYEKGQGTAKDQAEAVRLTQLSADQDNKFAQNNMGNIYAFGKGLPQDDKKAFEWYLKSAMQNYKIAQFNIATIYNDGLGIEKNTTEALEWAKKSAEQGFPNAQTLLGNIYCAMRNYDLGLSWYMKAAEQNDAIALNNIGDMYERGEGVPKDLNEANSYYLKATTAEPDNPLYTSSYWTTKIQVSDSQLDKEHALKIIKDEASSGSKEAQWRLFQIYTDGLYSAANENEAFHWLSQAADRGQHCALITIGDALLNGRGTNRDVVRAIQWYEKAISLGNADGMYNLGVIYLEGKYTTPDIPRGLKYLEDGAQAMNLPSLVYLSKIYGDGAFVKRDPVKSNRYLQTAADNGSEEAIRKIEETTGAILSCKI